MRPLLILIFTISLAGCNRTAGTEDITQIAGTWVGVAGGDSLSLQISGSSSNIIGLAEWGRDQYTLEGTHSHPQVSLRMIGPFTATNVVTVQGSLSDANTLRATMGTRGLPDQPLTLQRRESGR